MNPFDEIALEEVRMCHDHEYEDLIYRHMHAQRMTERERVSQTDSQTEAQRMRARETDRQTDRERHRE